VIRKYGENAPDLVKYYYWIFPFGLGLTLYSLFEVYAWQLKKSVFTNYLREVQFRLFITVLILLSYWGVITRFDLFIKAYSLAYLGIAFILLLNLLYTRHFHLTFSVSNVTRKFLNKILTLVSFVYGGNLVIAISSVFDSILIASVLPDGLALAGIYTLAQNLASLIQAPQRGIISSSMAALSRAWKDKDMGRIDRIYHRSSINMLVFSVGMFSLIWLNFSDAIFTFHLQSGYIDARWIFFYIGLMRIVDMGTGVNSQIIGTSTFWRFDFVTGIILLTLTLPLNYILTKYYFGVTGPAISNLISFSVYNAIRYWFLLKKFRLQPFTFKTGYTLALGAAGYVCCYFLFRNLHGFAGIFSRSLAFVLFYGAGVLTLKLSPDTLPVLQTFQKRLGIKKGG
jgi:O-antigen/teichoic acid export membrane protein